MPKLLAATLLAICAAISPVTAQERLSKRDAATAALAIILVAEDSCRADIDADRVLELFEPYGGRDGLIGSPGGRSVFAEAFAQAKRDAARDGATYCAQVMRSLGPAGLRLVKPR